ncbi:MAG: anhydro-N-acetylmuramic acid kinase [Thiotrichales bacterium]|nr:anhydro-N-acetylmuramic acid kinase [Thiotrichales bacterium]
MDAVDTALVDIEENKIELIDFTEYPIDETIRMPLRSIDENTPLKEVVMMDVMMGELFATAALSLIKKNNLHASDIKAIGSHGQTVLHSPDSRPPCTVQIGDPNVIASRTGITTVADFRRMDVANGGQGAPLAPLFHKAYFQTDCPRIVLNIGGIANITVLSDNKEDPVVGFDTGPGNCLMDDWIQQHKGVPYDENGEWARSGEVDEELLKLMLNDNYFNRESPKSTGRDDFNLDWLSRQLQMHGSAVSNVDVQATLLALTTNSIHSAIENTDIQTAEILVCGGGSRNTFLMEQLTNSTEVRIKTTGESGLESEAVEACCFAWLAKTRISNEPLNLKNLSGGEDKQLLGGIYSS